MHWNNRGFVLANRLDCLTAAYALLGVGSEESDVLRRDIERTAGFRTEGRIQSLLAMHEREQQSQLDSDAQAKRGFIIEDSEVDLVMGAMYKRLKAAEHPLVYQLFSEAVTQLALSDVQN